MKIDLLDVCPLPMRDADFETSVVWKKKQSFSNSENYLIKSPSGTGKSTLVAFLFGMRHDFSGDILFDGKSVRKISLNEWAEIRRTKLSCVLQDLRLIPQLSVAENLLLKNKLTSHKSESEIKAMLDRVGLSGKWDQSCGTLSFGQQQRVAVVRSLLQPFGTLILDEPFSHLDDNNIRLCSGLMEEECNAQHANMLLFSLGEHYYFTYHQICQL